MAILAAAALFFPSGLRARPSGPFHFRREEDTGARRAPTAAVQGGGTIRTHLEMSREKKKSLNFLLLWKGNRRTCFLVPPFHMKVVEINNPAPP